MDYDDVARALPDSDRLPSRSSPDVTDTPARRLRDSVEAIATAVVADGGVHRQPARHLRVAQVR